MAKNNKHHWVKFVNPRNQKVSVEACEHCGVMKSPTAFLVACSAHNVDHHMQKSGWVRTAAG